MEIAALGAIGLVVVIALVVVIVVILIIAGLIRGWYRVAKADEALVIVGKRQKAADGNSSRITVITGGGAIVNPLTQRGEMISLRARQIKMEPTAQSSNGVTVNVSGVALVKIGSDPESVRRAAERFASQDKAIEQFTTEQLEGALRGVVATLTVEELMRDRQRLSDQIAEGIKADLSSQGLILDSFQIQGVTDSNGYIAALGATEVERVKREAEVARINAVREIRARQIATDEANLIEQTALDKNSAAARPRSAAPMPRPSRPKPSPARSAARRSCSSRRRRTPRRAWNPRSPASPTPTCTSAEGSRRRGLRADQGRGSPRADRGAGGRRRAGCAPRPTRSPSVWPVRRAPKRSAPRRRLSRTTRRRCSRSVRSRPSCR